MGYSLIITGALLLKISNIETCLVLLRDDQEHVGEIHGSHSISNTRDYLTLYEKIETNVMCNFL